MGSRKDWGGDDEKFPCVVTLTSGVTSLMLWATGTQPLPPSPQHHTSSTTHLSRFLRIVKYNIPVSLWHTISLLWLNKVFFSARKPRKMSSGELSSTFPWLVTLIWSVSDCPSNYRIAPGLWYITPSPDLDQNSTDSVISLSLSWREEADGILLWGSGVFLSGGGRSCDNDRTAWVAPEYHRHHGVHW